MSKYPGIMTTEDVKKAEIAECKEILGKYHVLPEDIEEITDMIEQAYYMLSESYKFSSAVEAYIIDELGEKWGKDFFAKYVTHTKEPGEHLSAYMNKLQEEYEKANRFKVVK